MMSFNIVDIIGPILKKKVIANAKVSASTYAGREKINLSPSQDFMCMTKAYFNFKYSGSGYLTVDPGEFSYENERAKEVGNKAHEYIQSHLESAKVVLLNEKTLIDEIHKIKARLDLVVEVNGQVYLVELKTAKSYGIKMMVEEGSPDIEHQKQVQLYFHLLDMMKDEPEIKEKLKGRTINNAILLYEAKDDHKITEFFVKRNPAIIKDLLRYADVLHEHVKKGEEPNYKFEPDARECLWKCKPQYYLLCHGKERDLARNKPIIATPKDAPVWGGSEFRQVGNDDKFI